EERLTGWYWRVLTPGQVAPGDPLLLEQPAASMTLAEAMLLWQAHRPPLADLEKLAASPGIASQWQQKIESRLRWLAQHAQQ
ncbi:MAG TPA: MOSC domain-containing protein, partial [Azonexus sp.]|nr:MOSC domain-containing protein [Azonexus sp.]